MLEDVNLVGKRRTNAAASSTALEIWAKPLNDALCKSVVLSHRNSIDLAQAFRSVLGFIRVNEQPWHQIEVPKAQIKLHSKKYEHR